MIEICSALYALDTVNPWIVPILLSAVMLCIFYAGVRKGKRMIPAPRVEHAEDSSEPAERMDDVVVNPFPLCQPANIQSLMRAMFQNDWHVNSIKTVQAAGEVSELCKWILAHAVEQDKAKSNDDATEVKLCITMNNPLHLPPEQLFLKAFRANPL